MDNQQPTTDNDEVAALYDNRPEYEWKRLERHPTEFAVTLRAMVDYLPPAPAAVLDIGGGPGRYAIALAQRGYQVTLVDLSQANLALARQKAVEAGVTLNGGVHANGLDLAAFADGAYDAVLLMGPLYHLLTERERQQAIAEARRVLKPGGIIFAAFVTRFSPFRDAAKNDPLWVTNNRPYIEQLLATGVHTHGTAFAPAYFIHPSEVAPLMEQAGFQTLNLIGCEGIIAGYEERINTLTGEEWEYWVDLNYRLGQDPSLHGASYHLLYVGYTTGYS
jgi:SAM-dependent methyltransferase